MGRIFAIEEFSTFDGPGVRMTFFMKGCPLRCPWCHNPEGQAVKTEYMRSLSGCTGCGACLRAGNGYLTAQSIDACPRGLVRAAGEEYTPAALCTKILQNAELLTDMSGGVTFSGGEPTVQGEFLLQVLSSLSGKVHRAVQTCGSCAPTLFRQIIAECDYILYDLKFGTADGYSVCGTGDGQTVLDNLTMLANSDVPFVVRMPLIPGITDTEQNIVSVAHALRERGIRRIELLPYNRLAGAKYAALGRTYTPPFDETVPSNAHIDIWNTNGVTAEII